MSADWGAVALMTWPVALLGGGFIGMQLGLIRGWNEGHREGYREGRFDERTEVRP